MINLKERKQRSNEPMIKPKRISNQTERTGITPKHKVGSALLKRVLKEQEQLRRSSAGLSSDALELVQSILNQGSTLDPDGQNPLVEINCFQQLIQGEPHRALMITAALHTALTGTEPPKGCDPWFVRQRIQYELQAIGYNRCKVSPSPALTARLARARRYKAASDVAELMRQIENNSVTTVADELFTDCKRTIRRRGLKEEYRGKVIRLTVKANPRRPGTTGHALFAKIVDGMSVSQFLSIGGTVRLLREAQNDGHVKLLEVKD